MKIGDKVVCVDNSPCVTCGTPFSLLVGIIYIINELEIENGELLVGIIGYRPKCHTDGQLFISSRFRLLDHMKELATAKQHQHER